MPMNKMNSIFCERSRVKIKNVHPQPSSFEASSLQITHPLLWFLQHALWDFAHTPTFTIDTWEAWNHGYVEINRLYAEAVAEQISTQAVPSLVMLQDYHLYLAPRVIRQKMRSPKNYILTHFVHIPWPGSEDWGILPPPIREAILDGLCAADLLGFQTRQDSLNFIRTCEQFLPDTKVSYQRGRIQYRGHQTFIRDFPNSVDVGELHCAAQVHDVQDNHRMFAGQRRDAQMLLRIDSTDPSKNIVRGFLAYEEMLESYPAHRTKVWFFAILTPVQLELEEYQNYMDSLLAAAGRINARYGTSEWEPVRIVFEDDYFRRIAALQLYDVLLVNPVSDGMNLVAKEGPVVNEQDGVLILSERAGACQQLGEDALVVSPLDIFATAEALHKALIMSPEERRTRAERMRKCIEREDDRAWLRWQLEAINHLNL